MNTTDKADHEIARDEAGALFETLNVTCEISSPVAHMEKDWQAIAFNLTFSSGRQAFGMVYKMGIGHVKVKVPKSSADGRDLTLNWPQGERELLNTWIGKPNSQFRDKNLQLAVAVKLAQYQRVKPSSVEVLASVCAEAIEATESTFEDWCATFGYDEDSRQAEKTFDACRKPYAELLALIGLDNMRKLAEFHYRF